MKTEGLGKNERVTIRGVESASLDQGATALLTDMLRRVKAGEIVSLQIKATDINQNKITAYP